VAQTQAARAREGAAVRNTRRKLRGDFPTPPELVGRVVDAVMPGVAPGQRVSVLDPACGDGRFLVAAIERIVASGGTAAVCGVDVHDEAIAAARATLAVLNGVDEVALSVGDALAMDWGRAEFDVVLGNPPYLSQLSSSTTRGRASARGGGPYADVAAEFLALAVERAAPGGGRVGLVLPQSILGSRDVRHIRASVDRDAEMFWSWWSPTKHFDADVYVCALGFERRAAPDAGQAAAGNSVAPSGDRHHVWSDVVTKALGVPPLPSVTVSGTAGDRATFTANFRDEYYGMVHAVGDHDAGPRLVTSGLIDPNRLRWGERPVRFNKQMFLRPRLDVSRLDERMQAWARRLSVPKVLVANQTRVIECVADADGSALPGVPVVAGRPRVEGDPDAVRSLAAVLSSPFASAWAWHRVAGTGLSARTIRVGPSLLVDLPWPAGPLEPAIEAWQAGDLERAGAAVHTAYGIDRPASNALTAWWRSSCP
jgi:SAM-dependent methyltransferase